jgi:hydrogenase maturation protein HypF
VVRGKLRKGKEDFAGIQSGSASSEDLGRIVRVRIICRGVVQGVGFRPSVYRHAVGMGLSGLVRNCPEGATIEVEGRKETVGEFLEKLPRALPKLARLEEVQLIHMVPMGSSGFFIESSETGIRKKAMVPPDAAICSKCRNDMEDPANRRFHYPFTTCTECGPRFSITSHLPYDRSNTSMACFPLCSECAQEYTDPRDRRFHAEPISCPKCGPTLRLVDRDGKEMARDDGALSMVRELLAQGKIVAVKGLGGFHLACRSDKEETVTVLRRRKRRETKPFAVMVKDLNVAREMVELRERDVELLLSPESPIILAPKKLPSSAVEAVSPGVVDLGVMLPTTPLHLELFRSSEYDALIMTSGNINSEPICRGNREALARLRGIADFFLLHDRDILRRIDDSVVRSTPSGLVMVRRSRGYVPCPLPLGLELPEPVLSMGAHLQNTVAVGVGEEAFLSQHIGDLESDATRAFMEEALLAMERFLQVEPRIVAVDLHPDYASRLMGEKVARERGGLLLEIQHHLAHAASVLGEGGEFPAGESLVGAIVLDGTGLGVDGTSWGGEILVSRGGLHWMRVGRLKPIPLVGGEAAIREPWRTVVAALTLVGRGELLEKLPMKELVPSEKIGQIERLSKGPWPLSSGCGRIWEAAGSLLGLGGENHYEGELACLLESAAGKGPLPPRPWRNLEPLARDPLELDTRSLLAEMALRWIRGEPASEIAAGFHATMAYWIAEMAQRALGGEVRAIALAGGCMVNRHLRNLLSLELERRGFRPLLPFKVPPGDGGIAYGQAVLAAAMLTRGGKIQLEDKTRCV